MWIWERSDWPDFKWDRDPLAAKLPGIYRKQGELVGLAAAGNDDRALTLDFMLENILNSSAIEGEFLDVASVRSSLANHLGLEEAAQGVVPVSDRSEGVAHLMIDALTNTQDDLTRDRLFQWHSWLFPKSDYPFEDMNVGAWRTKGTMQVVSGDIGKPKVHYQAPPTVRVEAEMDRFIAWFNKSRHDPSIQPLERAALAHLWFVTIHPFDDGNGRIARAMSDLALAQDDSRSIHLHAMSAAILGDRKGYYDALENTQKGSLAIDDWVNWFAKTYELSLDLAHDKIDRTIAKARFWLKQSHQDFLPEQKKALNKLLDGEFPEGLRASKYAAFARVSKATATRHLSDLQKKGVVEKTQGQGPATRYRIPVESIEQKQQTELSVGRDREREHQLVVLIAGKLHEARDLHAVSKIFRKEIDGDPSGRVDPGVIKRHDGTVLGHVVSDGTVYEGAPNAREESRRILYRPDTPSAFKVDDTPAGIAAAKRDVARHPSAFLVGLRDETLKELAGPANHGQTDSRLVRAGREMKLGLQVIEQELKARGLVLSASEQKFKPSLQKTTGRKFGR